MPPKSALVRRMSALSAVAGGKRTSRSLATKMTKIAILFLLLSMMYATVHEREADELEVYEMLLVDEAFDDEVCRIRTANSTYSREELFGDVPMSVLEPTDDWLEDVDLEYVEQLWKDLVTEKRKRGPYTGNAESTLRKHRAVGNKEFKQSVWDSFERAVHQPGSVKRVPAGVAAAPPVKAPAVATTSLPQSIKNSAGSAAVLLTPPPVSATSVPLAAAALPAAPVVAAMHVRVPSDIAAPVAAAVSVSASVECDYLEPPVASLAMSDEDALAHLERSNLATSRSNTKFDVSSCHDHLRYMCVHRYFYHRCRGERRVAASMKAAEMLRAEPTEHQGRRIREWATEYAMTGELPELHQGKHAKRVSFIDDEDHANALRTLLRSIPRNLRTSAVFASKINETYPDLHVSDSTACRWMHILGFSPYTLTSKTYYDGHERPDVVEYRGDFIAKMVTFQARMNGYSGANMDIVHPPVGLAPGQCALLVCAHDESSVDSACGRQKPWVEEGHAPMLPKRGQCIMVSGIVSPNGVETYKLVEPSADGWWKNRDLIAQLEEWLPTLAAKYPGTQILVQFDNSGNHGVYAPDALIASRLNLSDGWPKLTESDKDAGLMPVAFRDTAFTHADGTVRTQTFTYLDGDGVLQHKGIRSILQERGKWREPGPIRETGFTLEQFKGAFVDHEAGVQGPNLAVKYRRSEESEMLLDEALTVLAAEPDFVRQREKNWITETVEKYGHIAIFGPKFHPELSPIEYFWGEMKRYLKSKCDYTLQTLRDNLPLAIASVPVATFRRHFAHVARYMRAYSRGGLSLAQIEWSMRKYTSHRRAKDAPADLDTQFLGPLWFSDMPESLKTVSL